MRQAGHSRSVAAAGMGVPQRVQVGVLEFVMSRNPDGVGN
jgi:hypothetical protein